MHNEPVDFAEILAKAQELGYAEKDPTADIGGFDTQRKCVISANLAFGTSISEEDVPVFGISEYHSWRHQVILMNTDTLVSCS